MGLVIVEVFFVLATLLDLQLNKAGRYILLVVRRLVDLLECGKDGVTRFFWLRQDATELADIAANA